MDKKQLILGAALALFVEKGFHGTATSAIAANAAIANGTLFNYFKSKEELVIALYHSVLSEMEGFIFASMDNRSVSKESFRSLFFATVSWSLANPVGYHYLQQFYHSPYFRAVGAKSIEHSDQPLFVLIQNGIDLVLIKQLPVDFIYSLFTAQVNGLHNYCVANSLAQHEEVEFMLEAFEMLWKMIEE